MTTTYLRSQIRPSDAIGILCVFVLSVCFGRIPFENVLAINLVFARPAVQMPSNDTPDYCCAEKKKNILKLCAAGTRAQQNRAQRRVVPARFSPTRKTANNSFGGQRTWRTSVDLSPRNPCRFQKFFPPTHAAAAHPARPNVRELFTRNATGRRDERNHRNRAQPCFWHIQEFVCARESYNFTVFVSPAASRTAHGFYFGFLFFFFFFLLIFFFFSNTVVHRLSPSHALTTPTEFTTQRRRVSNNSEN